jgi:hypothetical protein
MTKITEKQLIESLKQMREIKPRKEWAVLLRSQILAEKKTESKIVAQPAKFAEFIGMISSSLFQPFSTAQSRQKIAYSFAAFAFVVIGLVGFAESSMPGDLMFPAKKMAEQSQAALTGQTGLKNNIVALNSRINDLAQVAKEGKKSSIPSAIDEIKTNAKDLAFTLKANPVSDQKTLKEIAASLKTLANVPGTDLSENSDVRDLYQTVVQRQITDLQKTTLTEAQKTTLTEIESLSEQGKFAEALEKILLIDSN